MAFGVENWRSHQFGGRHAGRFLYLSPLALLLGGSHGSASSTNGVVDVVIEEVVEVNDIKNRKGKCNKKKGCVQQKI